MKSAPRPVSDIDAYIAAQPAAVRPILQKVRATIAAAAPGASETIKYGLPTFVLHSNLVHFGAFQKHIGFYATPTGHTEFAREFAAYESGKGSVQFPLAQPIPYDLIARIVAFRVQENTSKAAKAKKPAKREAKASPAKHHARRA